MWLRLNTTKLSIDTLSLCQFWGPMVNLSAYAPPLATWLCGWAKLGDFFGSQLFFLSSNDGMGRIGYLFKLRLQQAEPLGFVKLLDRLLQHLIVNRYWNLQASILFNSFNTLKNHHRGQCSDISIIRVTAKLENHNPFQQCPFPMSLASLSRKHRPVWPWPGWQQDPPTLLLLMMTACLQARALLWERRGLVYFL